ncbi:GD20909 [Drosophila simulans]|uniref:GD20909 n=1 Tax=Drosophila simulans TaxID=7240 RepID=B4QZB7_DROSI|nr:GD20909 [Drosophila simulans]
MQDQSRCPVRNFLIPSPSTFFVLIWRITLQIMYPYGYMDCSLQDALDNEYLVWNKGDDRENQMMLLRDTIQTSLLLVLMIELMLTFNIPFPIDIGAEI